MRVVRVFRRVVERHHALDGRAGRKPNGVFVKVIPLPVEIPIIDVEQRLSGAVRKRGGGLSVWPR